ncbi:MAG: polyisoprenoid-binding protein [Acidobacteriaceae bacterium]|nr:polyisoprenoid-binding protein [Acidobacteriaceae bacterium]MBV8573045.1 polyisoprenoid-binding protein [Acidobacteriaceae bacterium]
MNPVLKRFLIAGVAALPCAASQWTVDPAHSSATFAVKHMMVSTVRGSFTGIKGIVDYDPANPSATKTSFTIDAATVDTRNDDRDKDLKGENFFDVRKYPTITFVSKRLRQEGPGKLQLVGDITIHGVTKEVAFEVNGPTPPVKDMRGTLHVGGSATTTLNRKDFGLIWNKNLDGGGVMVGDDVDITVDVDLVQQK